MSTLLEKCREARTPAMGALPPISLAIFSSDYYNFFFTASAAS